MIVTITAGAHWRETHVPEGERQFAHLFDADSPEDVPHQAHNFITYANALGGYSAPHVLLRPDLNGDDEQDRKWVEVEMRDWREIVETATGLGVVEK